jgi:hypothetical protein
MNQPMNPPTHGPKTGREAPAGPSAEKAQDTPSNLDAMPPRETNDEPPSNESVEGGKR